MITQKNEWVKRHLQKFPGKVQMPQIYHITTFVLWDLLKFCFGQMVVHISTQAPFNETMCENKQQHQQIYGTFSLVTGEGWPIAIVKKININ